MYIGETSKQFQIRLQGHNTAYTFNQRKKTAFAKHLLESNHRSPTGSEKILHIENSYRKRLATEFFESVRHKASHNIVLNYDHPGQGLVEKLFSSSCDPHDLDDDPLVTT